jgi:hypothetical protein
MDHPVTSQTLRTFGLTVGGIFLGLGVWPAVVRGASIRLWAVALAGGLIVSALGWPTWLRWPYRGWMWLGDTLGWINTRLLLGVVFYGLVTPVGCLRRRRGQDPLQRHWDPEAATYRCVRQGRPRSHMTHQF